jgi:iron uptake system component EfeO
MRMKVSFARTEAAAALTAAVVAVALGCGGDASSPEDQALEGVTAFIKSNMTDLADASVKLQAAAPAASGWNATTHAAAVASMRSEWKRARVAYEHIEGAIAVLFPDLDYSTDQRYDAFIADNGRDDNLFDDQNVVGVHAIERILWSDEIPARVKTFEMGLGGAYKEAGFPATMQEADDFKNKLCAKLAADVTTMRAQFGGAVLDPAAAFRGVIGSMGEQIEKADLAVTGAEESRYAQFTLGDMRTNVSAGKKTFQAFKPWLKSKMGDAQITAIETAFARVDAAYAMLDGDALPPVPSTWSSLHPSDADLATPFGMLWFVLHTEADPDSEGSLVFWMNAAAATLGIPELPQ